MITIEKMIAEELTLSTRTIEGGEDIVSGGLS